MSRPSTKCGRASRFPSSGSTPSASNACGDAASIVTAQRYTPLTLTAGLAAGIVEAVDALGPTLVIKGGDFGAWRVFLHPEQRAWAQRTWNGSFRLAGGAGTGKTVVVLHRARMLLQANPAARAVVTTFTTNLAHSLRRDLDRLDPTLPTAAALGEPGAHVVGIDALAAAVIRSAGSAIAEAVEAVLGTGRPDVGRRDDAASRWREAIDRTGAVLRPELRSSAFFQAEYSLVILPNALHERDAYLHARRPGRGVRLSRADRNAVWSVVEAYRAAARTCGALDFTEAAAVAARHLMLNAGGGRRLADHVLVDEGQDLSPAHWQLVRALVDEGPNDIFIAEDSYQRIYGNKLVLGRYGIHTRGRSRRLTLNYRTTAENLRFARAILEGEQYVDLDEEAESTSDYRSARRGPTPVVGGHASLTDELDAAAETVRRWLKEAPESNVAPETLAILVRDKSQRDRVVAGLHERGVGVRAVDRETVKPGQPVVMTMHRAKGMEFAKVLLFGVAKNSIPISLRDYDYDPAEKADALLRERSLLYVAASRARDELVVSWSGQASELLRA